MTKLIKKPVFSLPEVWLLQVEEKKMIAFWFICSIVILYVFFSEEAQKEKSEKKAVRSSQDESKQMPKNQNSSQEINRFEIK